MNTTINALRVVTAVTLQRILTPTLWTAGGVLGACYTLTVLLATQVSGWWALLLIFLLPLTLIVVALGAGLWLASSKLFPNSYQKKHTKDVIAFTNKLMRLIENSKTPYPIHLFLIGKDAIRGKESSHLREIVGDSKTLKRDFEELKEKL